MKIIKTFLFLITMFLSSFTFVYAGAAEKWSYDVTPDQNQKLDVKGHKVDAYGNAANDYEYNRKIDPKTAANRTKMGTVGFGRLLKATGWGILGAAALQGLLEAVDWVIDPEAQSIWRYKKTNSTGYDCKNFGYKWKTSQNQVSPCPITAAEHAAQNRCKLQASNTKNCEVVKLCTDVTCTVDINTLPSNANPPGRIFVKISAIYIPTGATMDIGDFIDKDEKIQEEPKEKEQLTPDQLADYANHTHPDYSDPNLLPKLAPKYNPQIAPDLWKPANPWEYDNSPTVQEVKKELEQAKPEPKDDKIKENQPDPETGDKSWSLPAACDWFPKACQYFDWMQEKPDNDQEQPQQDINDQGIFSKKFDAVFSLSSQCPADIPWKLETKYLTANYTFSMKWLCIIFTFLGYPLVFASHCIGIWILYEAAVRKEMKW